MLAAGGSQIRVKDVRKSWSGQRPTWKPPIEAGHVINDQFNDIMHLIYCIRNYVSIYIMLYIDYILHYYIKNNIQYVYTMYCIISYHTIL